MIGHILNFTKIDTGGVLKDVFEKKKKKLDIES